MPVRLELEIGILYLNFEVRRLQKIFDVVNASSFEKMPA